MRQNIQLLIIDPQNDFCDLPPDWCTAKDATGALISPALPVAGAHADMLRLASFIDQGRAAIDGITVTLDSHHRLDIAHPTFWKTASGGSPAPFTAITAAQVRQGEYLPRDASALPRTLAYLDELDRLGRYTLIVWPIHCEIGSWGHGVHPAVKAAYNAWEDARLQIVQKVTKGSNPWTEHYSAIQAEVPDANDPDTQLNTALIAKLDEADVIVIAGEASSHCVRATTEHIADNLPSGEQGKIVLMTNCMSPVTGFEAQHEAFMNNMRERGVQLKSDLEVLSTFAFNG